MEIKIDCINCKYFPIDHGNDLPRYCIEHQYLYHTTLTLRFSYRQLSKLEIDIPSEHEL